MKLNKSKEKTKTQKEQLRAMFPDLFFGAKKKKKEVEESRNELFDSPAFLFRERPNFK